MYYSELPASASRLQLPEFSPPGSVLVVFGLFHHKMNLKSSGFSLVQTFSHKTGAAGLSYSVVAGSPLRESLELGRRAAQPPSPGRGGVL